MVGCLPLTSGAEQADFIIWSELSAWAPGKPQRQRQFAFHQPGRGQFVETSDDKITRFAEDVPLPAFDSSMLEQVFQLDDNYEPAKVPGLVVEGRASKILVIVSKGGRTKFITADEALLPVVLVGMRQQLREPPTRVAGAFLSIKSMPPAFRLSVDELARLPGLSPAALAEFSELRDGVAAPYRFIALSPERWRQIQRQIKLDEVQKYVKTESGAVLRLDYYP